MPVRYFQRNLVTFAKARPAQMIFITTSNIIHEVVNMQIDTSVSFGASLSEPRLHEVQEAVL